MKKLKEIAKYFNKVAEGCGPVAPPTAPHMNMPMNRPPMPMNRPNMVQPQLTPNQLNDPNFIAQIVAQVIMQMKNQGGIQEQNKGLNRMNRDMTPEEEYLMNNPSPGTSSPMNTQSGEFNTEVLINGQRTKVKIKYGHATGPVDDVTISWGNESHNVDFEEEDIIDDHGNEGKDMTFVAYSQDDKWRFIVDVSVEANYDMSGNIQDVMWDSLEIDVDDNLRLEPEDMDNPDEDLVIIGSGALDIENNFGERPSMTNGEYAAKGQEFVNDRFGGDKEAALDYIYNQINETKGTLKEVFQRRAGIIKNR